MLFKDIGKEHHNLYENNLFNIFFSISIIILFFITALEAAITDKLFNVSLKILLFDILIPITLSLIKSITKYYIPERIKLKHTYLKEKKRIRFRISRYFKSNI